MPRERYVTTRCVAGLNRARRKADDRERVFVTTHHSRVMSGERPKERQAAKIQALGKALVAAGFLSLKDAVQHTNLCAAAESTHTKACRQT